MRTRASFKSEVSRPNFDAIRLHIEYVSPERIVSSGRQLRIHSKASIRRLAAAMDRVGNLVPIITDEKLTLVSGDARLEAAIMLGVSEIPIIRVSHLSDEQLLLFKIFDNKIAEEGDWDKASLSLTFDELRLADPGLVLEDSGFSIGEIDAMVGEERTRELNDLDDTREEIAPGETVSRRGDLWQCGPHRLLCGNSLEPACIDLLADGAEYTQSLSDPPYGLATRFFSSGAHADFEMGAQMGHQEFTRFLFRYLSAILPHLSDGALVYAFMDHRHIVHLMQAAETAGLEYKQLLVWVKASAGLGSFYRSGHELVGVFRHGSGPSRNNIELGIHGRNRSNVLSYPGVMTSGGRKKALAMHPTVKNVAMLADLLLDASAPGDAILDCFGGSGSTLIAAEKTDRIAHLCEISPGFVDVAVDRFNALGVGEAQLVATGQTFAEVRAERAIASEENRHD